ncbi:MAG: hypothetical protein DRH44_04455 [Candidatus Coatesbacteria bacterium]|nr:MAG: hypothetical protein DRH44_04455 [Candidatus Coatesbacteria bacterium]
MVTKVDAIKRVLKEFGGVATLDQIYENIEKYYPSAKASKYWKAGIRGVVNREIGKEKNFKRIGLGIYALKEYEEEPKPTVKDKKRMHSYIEGICLEIGKFKNFDVYTPDKNALFKDKIKLIDIATINCVPNFTYREIVDIVKRIDVIWFNKKGFQFPQRVFEIVDAIGTLSEALNRIIQLLPFNTEFVVVGPEKYREKFINKIEKEPYLRFKERFDYKDYNLVLKLYESSYKYNKVEKEFFKRSI